MDYFERDHAWFAVFAPAEDPEIVVVVLNEHGGLGGTDAAPTAVALVKVLRAEGRGRGRSAPRRPGRPAAAAATAPPPPPGPADQPKLGAASPPGRSPAADVSLTAATERRRLDLFPWHVAVAVALICLLGVWNLASASRAAARRRSGSPRPGSWRPAPCWPCCVTLFDYRAYQRLAWPFYGLVRAAAAGRAGEGAGGEGGAPLVRPRPAHLQPSELMKIAVIMVLASCFHHDDERRKSARGLIGYGRPAAASRCCPAVLVLRQPDLGTAMMMVAIAGTMLLFARVRWRTLRRCWPPSPPPARCSPDPHLKPYQKKRVESLPRPGGRRPRRRLPRHASRRSRSARGRGWARAGAGDADQLSLPARAAHRLHLLGLGRGARLRRQRCCCWRSTLLLIARGGRHRRQRARPVRRLRRGGRDGDALLAGVRQHRDGHRAAAGGGRHPAADELRRLVGAHRSCSGSACCSTWRCGGS